jgi:hypothetical protein
MEPQEMVHQVYHKTLPLWIYESEHDANVSASWFAWHCKIPTEEMGIVSFSKASMKPWMKISKLND